MNPLVTWVMWNLASFRGDSVSVSARLVHGLRQTYHQLRNHFGRTRWYSLVMRLKWKLIWIHLETLVVLVQDRCMVGAKR